MPRRDSQMAQDESEPSRAAQTLPAKAPLYGLRRRKRSGSHLLRVSREARNPGKPGNLRLA
jgi:hypothetical protein